MQRSQPRRANPADRPTVVEPPRGAGGLLYDAALFGVLALFVIAVVWFAASLGELVALWRLGGGE